MSFLKKSILPIIALLCGCGPDAEVPANAEGNDSHLSSALATNGTCWVNIDKVEGTGVNLQAAVSWTASCTSSFTAYLDCGNGSVGTAYKGPGTYSWIWNCTYPSSTQYTIRAIIDNPRLIDYNYYTP